MGRGSQSDGGEYPYRGRRVEELDLPENARRCLVGFFTDAPCLERAEWFNPETGSRFCLRHRTKPSGHTSYTPLTDEMVRGADQRARDADSW